MGEYKCERSIHPGELLKEEVEYRGLTQAEVSDMTGIHYTSLTDILNGRRPLTAQTALLFEAALGISAGLLMRMQLDYTMENSRKDVRLTKRLESIRNAAGRP